MVAHVLGTIQTRRALHLFADTGSFEKDGNQYRWGSREIDRLLLFTFMLDIITKMSNIRRKYEHREVNHQIS